MDASVLWRAALAQAVCLAAVFALLVAAPLPESFFRDNGAVVGPLAWLVAALGAGRLSGLSAVTTFLAAAAGGMVAGALGALGGHTAGLVAGVAVFGVAAAVHRRGTQSRAPRPAEG